MWIRSLLPASFPTRWNSDNCLYTTQHTTTPTDGRDWKHPWEILGSGTARHPSFPHVLHVCHHIPWYPDCTRVNRVHDKYKMRRAYKKRVCRLCHQQISIHECNLVAANLLLNRAILVCGLLWTQRNNTNIFKSSLDTYHIVTDCLQLVDSLLCANSSSNKTMLKLPWDLPNTQRNLNPTSIFLKNRGRSASLSGISESPQISTSY